MVSYFLAFGWGICLLVSLIGWGGFINRILFPQHRVGWGQRGAWGMAWSMCVGGVLNLTQTISPTTILIYLGLGFLYWLFDIYTARELLINSVSKISFDRRDWVFILGVFAVVLLNIWHYAGSVYSLKFQGLDDYHAYFVYPHKMLQTGFLGLDPFSERRLSSLGGQPFLHTFALSLLGNENFYLIDPGVAFLISVGILWEFLQDKNVAKQIAVLFLFVFLCIYYPQLNTSSTVTGTVMFLSLFATLEWEGIKSSNWIANACIVALVVAGICSLKTSYIPACGILILATYLFYILGSPNDRRVAIYEFILVGCLSFLLLLPWMIAMYQSSGTLLYPLLGKGYHGSAYGSYLHKDLTLLKAIKITISSAINVYGISLLLLGCAFLGKRNDPISGREASLSLLVSAVLGIVIIALSTGGVESYRYSFPFVSTALIVLMIVACVPETGEPSKLSNTAPVLIAMVVAGIMIGNNSNSLKIRYAEFAGNIKSGINHVALVPQQQVAQYIKMQQSIAEGEILLTRLEKPFLLNFKRNQIFIADWPGGVSPPPGMPLYKGSEPLADYLTAQSIKYVAYSYAKEASYSKAFLSPGMNTENTWLRNQADNAWDFQDNLKELGNTRKRVYDDGDIFILDLSSRSNRK
jgi:hypothetical protein